MTRGEAAGPAGPAGGQCKGILTPTWRTCQTPAKLGAALCLGSMTSPRLCWGLTHTSLITAVHAVPRPGGWRGLTLEEGPGLLPARMLPFPSADDVSKVK